MQNLITRSQTFFFAPVQLRPVRIFSILTACLVFYNFRYWQPYGLTYELSGFQLWQYLASTYVYRWILLFLTIAFIAGMRPRLTGLVLVAMLYPILYEPTMMQSRQILLFTLLCLALLNGGKSARALPMWPIRLIQLQLSVIYGINALAKSSAEYLSGDVLVAMSITLPNFWVDMSDGFYHIAGFSIPVGLAAKASVLVEGFLALAFWHPLLRFVSAAVGILFHFQLKTMISIGMLDWTTMFLYLSFLMSFVEKGNSGGQWTCPENVDS